MWLLPLLLLNVVVICINVLIILALLLIIWHACIINLLILWRPHKVNKLFCLNMLPFWYKDIIIFYVKCDEMILWWLTAIMRWHGYAWLDTDVIGSRVSGELPRALKALLFQRLSKMISNFCVCILCKSVNGWFDVPGETLRWSGWLWWGKTSFSTWTTTALLWVVDYWGCLTPSVWYGVFRGCLGRVLQCSMQKAVTQHTSDTNPVFGIYADLSS